MANKHLLFQAAAREKILHGATSQTDAVRVTLGPRSKCVLIEKKWGKPIVCNDGVTIAKEIELKDPEENLGARMIREAAEKTGDAVGDGTSTSTILAHAIYAEGLKNVAAGASTIDLKRGLDRGLRAAVTAIKALSRPVESRKEKAQVAAISAHNDPTIGETVADAVEKVGREGVISVEEAKGTETALEVVEGMQFDRGYLALLQAIEAVEKEEGKCDGDERTGRRMLKRALEAPTRQIAENSGADGSVVVEQMRTGKGNYGFDAAVGKYVDLVEAGIIDPTKVVRVALENAVSVARVLLLTEATLTELPEEKREGARAGGLAEE
jgi:chaperonin GroEL (HSP60 family)